MNPMEEHLESEGYQVVNVDYPSRDYPVAVLTELAIPPALESCGDQSIHFVTHSLGGILVRQYLANQELKNLKRVVMLGPPNHGSEVVDKLQGLPGFYTINGDAGYELGTHQDSVPNSLGPANFDLGIIAGTRTINFVLSTLIPGTDDGKVSVESSKLEGMNDHIEMPVTHAFMMRNTDVMNQVVYYLQNGSFKRDE